MIEVVDTLLQWREKELETYQINHADGESGTFNIIIPLTNDYTLGFHPGTQHIVTTTNKAETKNPTIVGKMTKTAI